jgi:outer membrane lipoprotein-sorting protein
MCRSRWLFVAVCAVLASPVAAQTPSVSQESDPKAEALLDQSAAAYKALKGIHIRMRADTKAGRHMTLASEVWFQRPDRFRVDLTKTKPSGDTVHTIAVCDGKKVWRWNGDTNVYTVDACTASSVRTEIGNALFPGEVIVDGSPRTFTMGGGTLSLAPPRKIGAVDVDVARLVQVHSAPVVTMTVEFSFRHSDHLLQGATIVGQTADPNSPQNGRADVTHEIIEPDPRFAASTFRFTPPPGAKPVGAQTKPPSKGKQKATKTK